MSRWLVIQEHQVTGADLAEEGNVSDTAVERWVELAREAYLEECKLLRQSPFRLTWRNNSLPRGAYLGRPTDVAVSASASEFKPNSFTVSIRIRPGGGDREMPINATCVVRLEDESGEAQPLGDEIRDELIALEHSARHFN